MPKSRSTAGRTIGLIQLAAMLLAFAGAQSAWAKKSKPSTPPAESQHPAQTADAPAKEEASPSATPAAATPSNIDAELAGEKPELTFSNTRYEFGELYRGQKSSFAFKFRNTGKAPLEIRSIHSACGCINTKVEPRTRFLPGEEGNVSFEFDSTWFSGPVTKTITIDSNDLAQPTTVLTVGARVIEELRASPAIISAGEISKDSSSDFNLSVDLIAKAKGTDVAANPASIAKIPAEQEALKKSLETPTTTLKILGVTTSSKSLVAEYAPQAGNRQQIRIRLRGPLPSGPFRERVTIWNTSTYQKEYVVPIIAEVVGHLRPSTRYIEFGVVKPGEKSRRILTLVSDDESFKVEGVTVELRKSETLQKFEGSELISSAIERTSRNTTVTFELRVPQKLQFSRSSINISGTILVRTNDADMKELRVPFFGVLQQEEEP
jgi:hypothetical protein